IVLMCHLFAVKETRNYGAPAIGAGRGRCSFCGGRMGPRREFGEGNGNGVEGGYGGGGFGDSGFPRREEGDGKAMGRGHGPRQPYRGGGRRGGYTDSEAGDESGRPPRRAYERHSGTGRGYGMKCEVETVETEGAPAVAEAENKLEEAPQSEVEKGKEGESTEVEEPEDKGSDKDKKKENLERDERAKK
ncbi:hypothetical protein ACJX0J_018765, partial [Zea mays]